MLGKIINTNVSHLTGSCLQCSVSHHMQIWWLSTKRERDGSRGITSTNPHSPRRGGFNCTVCGQYGEQKVGWEASGVDELEGRGLPLTYLDTHTVMSVSTVKDSRKWESWGLKTEKKNCCCGGRVFQLGIHWPWNWLMLKMGKKNTASKHVLVLLDLLFCCCSTKTRGEIDHEMLNHVTIQSKKLQFIHTRNCSISQNQS